MSEVPKIPGARYGCGECDTACPVIGFRRSRLEIYEQARKLITGTASVALMEALDMLRDLPPDELDKILDRDYPAEARQGLLDAMEGLDAMEPEPLDEEALKQGCGGAIVDVDGVVSGQDGAAFCGSPNIDNDRRFAIWGPDPDAK